jgi:hypothetical protein
MKDSPDEVICAISCNLLVAVGQPYGLTNPVFIFWALREKVERAASAKYDRTTRKAYEILAVQERDLLETGQSLLTLPRGQVRSGVTTPPPAPGSDYPGS